MKKILVFAMTVMMAISLCACGGTNKETWGHISVAVPEGYQLEGGDVRGADPQNENICVVRSTEHKLTKFYEISLVDEKTAEENVKVVMDVNNGTGLNFTGKRTWQGVTAIYHDEQSDTDLDYGMVYCTEGDVTIQVLISGNPLIGDAAVPKLLDSIEVN